jgi:hypothetical protein
MTTVYKEVHSDEATTYKTKKIEKPKEEKKKLSEYNYYLRFHDRFIRNILSMCSTKKSLNHYRHIITSLDSDYTHNNEY